MIAIAKEFQSDDDKFLSMLPQIKEQARIASRSLRPDAKEDFIAEVVANAFCAYARLVERGKEDVTFATPLAMYAIKQVRAGRRVGTKMNVRDITSRCCQVFKNVIVERLDKWNDEDGNWQEILIEDRRAGPAETAAARLDTAAWFKSLGRKKGRIAKALARGERTQQVARRFGLSSGRISQLRNEFRESWGLFQGELAAA